MVAASRRKKRDETHVYKSDRWTPEQDKELTALIEAGATFSEIAHIMQRTKFGIANRARTLRRQSRDDMNEGCDEGCGGDAVLDRNVP